MRKFLISILLAGAVAAPALAQDNPDNQGRHNQQQNDKDQARQARDEAKAERANVRQQQQQQQQQMRQEQQVQRQQQQQMRQEQQVQRQQQQQEQHLQQQAWQQQSQRQQRQAWQQQQAQQAQQQAQQQAWQEQARRRQQQQGYSRAYQGGNGFSGGQAGQVQQVDRRNWNGDQQTARRGGRDTWQGNPNMRGRGPLVVSSVPREGTQPPPRTDRRNWSASNWNRDWRGDDRYDWRDWRQSHRTIFHIGIYYDPFGWGYRPYEIGWRLWPNYYSQQYWINDPWMYRLPYAPPGLVWVRYWNDALLVDPYSGEVVDVIHDFFW